MSRLSTGPAAPDASSLPSSARGEAAAPPPAPAPVEAGSPAAAPVEAARPAAVPVEAVSPAPAPVEAARPAALPVQAVSPAPAPVEAARPAPAPVAHALPTVAAVDDVLADALPTVAAVDDVLADLEWRGMVASTTDRDALARDLAAGPVVLYCGFDPTADSLHVGNLVPLFALRRFQLAGHRPIALAGGATGAIGDPSGRTAERALADAELVAARTERLRGQMTRFLDFSAGALLLDNLEWTAPLSVLDFLRDVGKHFPVNQMLARQSVAARLAGGGLSFTEFSYQLLQSYDYLELYRRHGCRLQVGATDQWGNITAGLDLIRRVEGAAAHALTFPLITDASGAKIGKSTGGGNVWLDPALTSPYALYQYLLNVDDRDVGTYLRLLTFVGREDVEALDESTAHRPHARAAQRRLARELVALVHGPAEVERVDAASTALFGGGDLGAVEERVLAAALAEAPLVRVDGEAPPVVELLAQGLGLSRSEARRVVKEGGAYLNNVRVQGEAARPREDDWLYGRFLVLRRGRRSVTVVERPKPFSGP